MYRNEHLRLNVFVDRLPAAVARIRARLCAGRHGGRAARAGRTHVHLRAGGVVHPHAGDGHPQLVSRLGPGLRRGGDAGAGAELRRAHGAPAGTGRRHRAGGGHRCAVLVAVAAAGQAGHRQHRHLPGGLRRRLPGRGRADRLLLRGWRGQLPGVHHAGPAAGGGRAHGRRHLEPCPGVRAHLRAARLRARCHGHGQGDRRLPGFAAGPRQGRHVLCAAGFAVHRLGHLRLEGVGHGHRGARRCSRR